jgi:hypothetical protein
MKCPKCGYNDPYWRADWHDVEREYAKLEDVFGNLPVNVQKGPEGIPIEAEDGFTYRKGTSTGKPSRYVRRIATELWRSRGFWTRPKGYFDPAGSINRGTLVVKGMDGVQATIKAYKPEGKRLIDGVDQEPSP